MAGSTAPKQGNPFGESGELCPKSKRHPDDLSGRWSLQFIQLSENAIRPFTVGRRNWLFSASPKGAASSAIVYTMVEMAKANDLNTYKYLTYLLSQRPDAKMSDEQLEQLAPWSETAKANCQN